MGIQLNRFGGLILLTMLVIGCGGREYHREPTAEIKLDTTTVTALQLNLRDNPTAKSKVLQVLYKGEPLEILSSKGNWLEVTAPDGQNGWVHSRYVQTDKKGTGATGPSKKPASPPKKGEISKAAALPQPTPVKTLPPNAAPKKVPALHQQLEAVWETRRQAHRDGLLALIRKVTSDHSYCTLQNHLAAVGRELKPENATALYELMPDLARFEFVELKQNGPTAGLLYLEEGQKSADPNLPPSVHFLFIKFVKEARGWTVDRILSKGEPKYQKDGSETRYNYADLPEQLAIDGKVRPAPQAVEKPKEAVVEGAIDISSYDYKTEASINGIQQKGMEGATSSGPIKGGLKKGANKIEIVAAKSAKATSDWPPEVTIRYLDASGQEQEAFKFAPEENVVGTHDFTFTVE